MRKFIFGLFVLIGILLITIGAISLNAAEIGTEYVLTDEDGTYKIVLIDESKVSIFAESSEEIGVTFDAVLDYELIEENIIYVKALDSYIELKEDGSWDYWDEPELEPEPIIYPCQVVIKDTNYGEIIVDVKEGEIGEIVTIMPKSYAFCVLVNITVNGVELLPNEDGEYKFALVEGENVIRANFAINQQDMEVIAGLINSAKKGNFEDLFAIENLFNLGSWIITILFSSGFLVTLVKLKKVKAETTNDVVTTTDDTVKKSVEKYIKEAMEPILLEIKNSSLNSEEISKVLARCMVLAQENTAESRLAIINELTKLQTSSQDLAVKVQAVIADEVSKSKKIYEEKIKAIEDLKKSNKELKIEKESSSEGRI